MIVNGHTLFSLAPIKDMEREKIVAHGMTYGLGEAGYDIRIKQGVEFHRKNSTGEMFVSVDGFLGSCGYGERGRFTIASAVEEFQMPSTLLGRVCDKSSWARKGLSVFNTVIEPGWRGFLTLELVYHGADDLLVPAGAPIAQVLFEEVRHPAAYEGRYQGQEDAPVGARVAGQ